MQLRVINIICFTLIFSLFCEGSLLAAQSDNEEKATVAIKVTLLSDLEYRPYSYLENGRAEGLLIDLVRAVDEQLHGFDIDIVPTRWPKAKAHMRNGDYLGLIGPYFHAHDWPYLYPYSYPIHHEELVTVCKKSVFGDKAVQWPLSYSGLKIGTVAGYDGWLDDGIRQRETNTVNYFEFPTTTLALEGVHREIIDCTLFEKATFNETLSFLKQKGKIDDEHSLMIVNDISVNSVHIGYSEKAFQSEAFPYAYDFQKAFDAKFFEMLKSGELTSLFEKYGVEYF